jgi:muramoyltetrapeptide carboxypeptidase
VALVAPAGPLRDAGDLERAAANARSLGWDPVPGANALARLGYFAGTDAARLADLNNALNDPAIDAVWCIRGGYGAMRILAGIDYEALVRRPRALIGYSDITAIHAAAGISASLVTFHGPTARSELTPFSRSSLERAVRQDMPLCGAAPDSRTVVPGRSEGRLAGGNLALLASLAGTPYAPDLHGAILVLEDIDEAVYRLDRMLVQLRLSGMLAGVRGLVFGAFTNCPEASDDGSRTLDDLIDELAGELRVPCFAGAPFGHITDQWTLPLGAMAELDADARALLVHR